MAMRRANDVSFDRLSGPVTEERSTKRRKQRLPRVGLNHDELSQRSAHFGANSLTGTITEVLSEP